MATRGRSGTLPPSRHAARAVDVDILALDANGVGCATLGAHTLTVPFTIPGERVRVAVVEGRTHATLLEVVRASPARVQPRCAHFGPSASAACGGCTWQHIAYPEQRRLKTALVDRLVRARVPEAPRAALMLTAHGDAPWGYRQKVHFVFGHGPGRGPRPLLMGHYAAGSRRVVPVEECPVHDPRGNAAAFAIRDTLARYGVQASSPSGEGTLESVAVRVAHKTEERMVTVVATSDRDKRLRTATKAAIASAPADVSFHLNIHDTGDGYIFGTATRTLAGAPRLRDEVGGCAHLMSPTAFFQTNVAAAGVLVSLVLDAMPTSPSHVLDLYAGAGLFSIPLARAGHRVTAVESNRQAVADGIASLKLNGLTAAQCRFVASRTEQALAPGTRADVVVLDPPREGCAPSVIARLFGGVRPTRAVYVSCDPTALARDLAGAVSYGYRVTSLTPVDMFPHTPHVETVAILDR